MTKARKAVLDVLQSATSPLSAKDVYFQLGDLCNQVTVYRTLHYLEEKGFAESFVLHCNAHGTERYYTILEYDAKEKARHHHWFHCEICHQFTDLGDYTIDSLLERFSRNHAFEIHDHMLSLVGVCKICLDRSSRAN